MTISDITTDTVKTYLRLDADDALVEPILAAALDYACHYTGRTSDELNQYSDVPIAILALCADMYDVRAFTMNGIQVNPTAAQILGSHSQNFL